VSEVPARENFALLPHGTEALMYLVLIPFAAVFLYGLYLKLSEYGIEALRAIAKTP
jgi:hypothetical protein